MSEFSSPKRFSRRTIARGAAWTVPAIAVAAPVASAASSPPPPPPPPEFNFCGGCGTVGNGDGGCNGAKFTGQVPVSFTNPAGAAGPLVFQIVGVASQNSNGGGATTNFTVWTNNGTENNCGPQITSTGCNGYISITVNPGETKHIWIVSAQLQSASAFDMTVAYRWIEPCTPPVTAQNPVVIVASGSTGETNIGANNNCDNSEVDTDCVEF